MDGRSFTAVLQGKTHAHRDVIFASHSQDGGMNLSPMRCARTSRYKYILNLSPENQYRTHMDKAKEHDGGREYWDSWETRAQSDPRAALILKRYHWRPRHELYDLLLDPFEIHNLAGDPAYADIQRDLSKQLATWREQQNDSKTGPDPVPVRK
jgi:N-sulfoglucosamine sulfohydrolase